MQDNDDGQSDMDLDLLAETDSESETENDNSDARGSEARNVGATATEGGETRGASDRIRDQYFTDEDTGESSHGDDDESEAGETDEHVKNSLIFSFFDECLFIEEIFVAGTRGACIWNVSR